MSYFFRITVETYAMKACGHICNTKAGRLSGELRARRGNLGNRKCASCEGEPKRKWCSLCIRREGIARNTFWVPRS